MNCTFLDEKGARQPMIMGCYGLGIGRTVAAAIEQSHDDDGIIWPMPIAPFEVVVTQIGKEDNVRSTADGIYRQLRVAGIDAILDDRDERPGVKLKRSNQASMAVFEPWALLFEASERHSGPREHHLDPREHRSGPRVLRSDPRARRFSPRAHCF